MDPLTQNSSQGKFNFDQAAQDELVEKLTKNKSTPEMQRMSYFALLASSMMFREMFFRDDIQRFKDSPPPQVDRVRTKEMSNLTSKTVRKMHKQNNEQFERNILKFNAAVYREIETTTETMSPAAKVNFEEIAGFVTLCMEELLSAYDKQEVLGLLKMYNAGELDFMFLETRKLKLQQNAENTTEPVKENI